MLETAKRERVRGVRPPPKPVLAEGDEDMASKVYEPQKGKRSEQLNARTTKLVKTSLATLARIWTHFDREELKDPDATWSEADVINRLLERGINDAFDEIGFRPVTEAEILEVLSRSGGAKARAATPSTDKKK